MDAADIPLRSDALLAGPRGRRLLLEYAIESERILVEDADPLLGPAVFLSSYHLDPGRGGSVVLFGPGAEEAERATADPEEIAALLRATPLAPVTEELLRTLLARSVDAARYWQEPDGEDVLAATGPVREELGRIARHVAGSPLTRWWVEPLGAGPQWSIRWEDVAAPCPAPDDPAEILRAARAGAIAAEERAQRERPEDPTANWSGDWWSQPPWGIPSSSRELFDGSPAGLWFVEDSMGWELAEAIRVGAPAGLRVYEIDGADAWGELCRRYPLEVTAQVRHDWYRTTGRAGRWVLPDWAAVAEEFDAVHLQTAGYLAAAGRAIPVDEERAGVIAGWAPDATFWLSDRIRMVDAPVQWRLVEEGAESRWGRVLPSEPLPRARGLNAAP